MLAQQEVMKLKDDRDTMPRDWQIDVVDAATFRQSTPSTSPTPYIDPELIWAILEEKFTKFSSLLEDKENKIEDKNKIIYLLQNKIWELESRIKWMIALPDYTQEKQKMIEQKQQLEYTIETMSKDVKRYKTESYLYIWIFLVAILLAFVFYIYTR